MRTSLPAIPPFAPRSTNAPTFLPLSCADTEYVVATLYTRYVDVAVALYAQCAGLLRVPTTIAIELSKRSPRWWRRRIYLKRVCLRGLKRDAFG